MKNIFNIKSLLLALTLGVGAMMTGCDDDESLPKADALFRPIVNETIVGGQWIELNWDRYEGADSFQLELSGEDGLELTAETDTTFYRFEGLSYDTDYVIKIRSFSRSSGLESKFYIVPTITTTDIVTDLKEVQTIDNMALVSWGSPAIYNNLKIFHVYTPEGATEETEEVIKEIPLSSDELALGQIIIDELEPENNYIVRAYYGDTYLGKKKFTTKAPENYEGAVIDLRSYSEEDSYSLFTQSFIDDAVAQYPDQNITIVLQGGVAYELATVLLPATTGTISVVTGQTLRGNASFRVSGNLGVKDGASVGGFIVNNVFFTEHDDKPKTSGNFGGCYLFNFNKSGASLGTLKLLNSTIKYKRGLCRIQTKASIDNFIMDNCIVDSIGGYGITNADNGDADIKNINITNSTFSHCEKLFVSTKPNSKSVNSFFAEKCTFVYNMKDGNNYMFDFNNMSFGSDPKLKDCLFGPGGNAVSIKEDGSSTGSIGAFSAFRAAKGSMTLDNCYGTTDIKWYMADGATEPASALELTSTKTDVNATFSNAAGSNFSLINLTLKGVAGDPRW